MTSLTTAVLQAWQHRTSPWEQPWKNGSKHDWPVNAAAEQFVTAQGIPVQFSANALDPRYNSGANIIEMPCRQAFKDAPSYYSSLFHELAHSTMLPLERPTSAFPAVLGDLLADPTRNVEEATAELAAYQLLQHFQLANDEQRQQSADYVAGWLLRYPTALPIAEQRARKAAHYLLTKAGEK